MKELIRKIVEKAVLKVIPKCKRIVIKDRKGNKPYLIRYILLKNSFFSIYIHRFMCSDLDVHHDHPWNFFTYIVTKGYKEESIKPVYDNKGLYSVFQGVREPGSLAYRRSTDTHKVMLKDGPYELDEEEEAPLTVCLLLKRKRMWGFVKPFFDEKGNKVGHTWINWMDYLNINPSDPSFDGSE